MVIRPPFANNILKLIFSYEICWNLIKISLTFVPMGLYVRTDSYNDSTPIWRRVIIWTNGGLVYWRIYTSLDLDESMRYPYIEHTAINMLM